MVSEAPEFLRDARPIAREVQSRRDLAEYLNLSLPGQYTTTVGDAEVRSTATQVKSYLLEAHDEPESPLLSRLASIFGVVTHLTDKSLIRVEDSEGAAYFLDLQHPRFPVLHTTFLAERSDKIFKLMTEGTTSGFDHVWMPGQFLRGRHRGLFTGFAFRYATEVAGIAVAPEVDSSTGEIREGSRRLRMQVLEDMSAESEYVRLVKSEVFEGRKALEHIQFRSADADAPSEVITNTVYSYGKIVGKGTSLQGHLLTVATVVDAYAGVIKRIEDEFALGWVPRGQGFALVGEPFVFEFPPELEVVDLESFAGSLFNSTRPFRLFGIPDTASPHRVDVEAIDLHTGDPLSFEITSKWMRVYLPRGSCGNIIARLYSNLQHSMSSDVRLWVGDDEDPFSMVER